MQGKDNDDYNDIERNEEKKNKHNETDSTKTNEDTPKDIDSPEKTWKKDYNNYEKRLSKMDKTLNAIMKFLTKLNNGREIDIDKSQSNVTIRNKYNDKLKEKNIRRNEVIKIKEEDIEINDNEKEKDLKSYKSNDSKKSTGDEKSYNKKRLEQSEKIIKNFKNTNFEEMNIVLNNNRRYSNETSNCAPTLKNNAIFNQNMMIMSEDDKKENNNISNISSKENIEETPRENDEKFIDQYQDLEQEDVNGQDHVLESHLKYKKVIKKKSLLSKKFRKKYRKKREESSYSPPNYANRKISQSMLNYSRDVQVEEHGDDELLEKEKKEREKMRDKEREKIRENRKMNDFKYYFDGHIINNKKIRWEVKIKRLSGWFSIGVGERVKTSHSNEKQNHTMIIVDKEYIINKINFLLTNDHCTIMWEGGKNNINKARGSFNIKEGDNLIFIYSPKFNQLKIQKNNSTYVIENIDYYSDQWLVPCAIFSRKNDKAIFRNFHVLADYNNIGNINTPEP